jgi:tellurite resistance protein
MATLPISILLLVSLGIQLFWGTSSTLNTLLTFAWCVGSILEIAATVWVVGRWLNSTENGGFQWATFTPVFFIPVVGNVLAPIGGVPIGLENWATAQFGVGLFFWPILQAMLFVRMTQAGPLPARMAPTWFIALVPPSLIGLSLLQLNAPIAVVWAIWGIGAFFLALVLTKVHTIREHAFGMPYWATSFPSAAFTTFTLRMSHEPGGAWLELPATVMLALTSLLILGLTLQTWRGLRHGHLLVAEK